MPNEDTRPAPVSATLPDLGPEFNAAREHLRATVLDVIDDGMHDGDPLKCLATVATALLGAATIERDMLAAEVKRVNEMRGDDAEAIERLEAERDEWKAAAQLRMTTGFAFGIRAQAQGGDRPASQTPEWLAGFDFMTEMFGGAADS